MPRKRMIAPEFFTSSTMNGVPITTMLTFAGIWCWADDFGRGEDDETLVKAAIWPRRRSMTEKKVRDDMDALIGTGVLCQYAVNGHRLLHVVAWHEHQKISHPTKSKLPPCPEHNPEAWQVFLIDTDPATEKFRDVSRGIPEGFANGSGGDRARLHDSVVKGSSDQVSQVQNANRRSPGGRVRDGLDLVS